MPPTEQLLTAILDGPTLMQAQLQRIETRLDAIDAAMAGLTDVEPALEQLLAAGTADREEIRHHFGTIATIAAFTHAAATGGPASLPAGVADDSLLDRYVIDQPSMTEPRNASLKLWPDEVGQIETLRLAAILERQYRSSPTDTPESRVPRYQFAAISRYELKKRRVVPSQPPSVSRDENPSTAAKTAKSTELANLWRGGTTPELLAEPEFGSGCCVVFRSHAQQRRFRPRRVGKPAYRFHQQDRTRRPV